MHFALSGAGEQLRAEALFEQPRRQCRLRVCLATLRYKPCVLKVHAGEDFSTASEDTVRERMVTPQSAFG